MNHPDNPAIALPRYKGLDWARARLPQQTQAWAQADHQSLGEENNDLHKLAAGLADSLDTWRWPKRPLYFFSDLHADADAFADSLVASGGVKKTGPNPDDFRLTADGRKACFIIGGDCFDKGPSNLALLRSLKHLIEQGARVRILAGNHDVRLLLGMRALDYPDDIRNCHFFVRLGHKLIPLLCEIRDEYLSGKNALSGIPGESECRRRLLPPEHWAQEFQAIASEVLTPKECQRELARISKKSRRFEKDCAEAGLDMRTVYAVALKWHELFLSPQGEFAWFFKRMRLAYRAGSFLFVHAGLDDDIAAYMRRQRVKDLNLRFKAALEDQPFQLYYGSLANVVRTKYRKVDKPLSPQGRLDIAENGIHAIVHGHRNLMHGQRLMMRRGVLNFECDASVDRNTRKKEGLDGYGAAVTIVHPRGQVLGISSDHPYIKVFEPAATLAYLRSITQA